MPRAAWRCRYHVATVSVKVRRTSPRSFAFEASGKRSGNGKVRIHCLMGTSGKTRSTSGVGAAHAGDAHMNLHMAIAGRGGGSVSPGRHLVAATGTPLPNLHLTLLNKFGAKVNKFGLSTGTVPNL